MSETLILTLEVDGAGDVELRAEFESKGFAGGGSAWFSRAKLERKIDQFLQCPLEREEKIVGGYHSPDLKGIEQEHLCLSVRPIGRTGELVLSIKVSSPSQSEAELRRTASAEFKTNYQQISDFVLNFKRLIMEGGREKLTFESF